MYCYLFIVKDITKTHLALTYPPNKETPSNEEVLCYVQIGDPSGIIQRTFTVGAVMPF